MFSGASGFYNAPLIKLVTVSTGLATLAVPSFHLKKILELSSLEQLTQNHQIWRIFTNNFFFSSAFEAMLGVFLLYHFRLFERQMGSSKFAAFVSTTWGVSVLSTLALFVFFNPKTFSPSSLPASGPYPLIFSLLVQYYFEVPATYRFRVLGVNGSNTLQMLGSKMPGSIILGISGIIAGLAYRSDALPLKRFAVPQSIVKFCAKYILPVLQQARRPPQRNVTRGGARGAAPAGAAGGIGIGRERIERVERGGGAGGFEALPPPPESDVTALMDLGFSREAALGALRNANNDTQLAAALLLDPS